MDTKTLTPKVAAAAFASAHAGNRNLSTEPKRMAVIKVWDAMMRGARIYCEQEGFAPTRMPAWPAWPSSSSAKRTSASACLS